jgi:hypothetical protein
MKVTSMVMLVALGAACRKEPADTGPRAAPIDAAPAPAAPDAAPDPRAALILPDPLWIAVTDGTAELDPATFTCLLRPDHACAEEADCMPPEPQPIRCPRSLLPRLPPELEPRRDRDRCFHDEVEVACPPLYVRHGERCFVLGDGAPVDCPSGPLLVLPEPSRLDRGAGRTVYLEPDDLQCYESVKARCKPGKRCIQRAPQVVACPDQLLLDLEGASPTEADGACHWNGYRVRCP